MERSSPMASLPWSTPSATAHAAGANLLLDRGLGRRRAVVTSWLAAIAVALMGAGAANTISGLTGGARIDPIAAVALVSLLVLPPVITGALTSLTNPRAIRFGQLGGPALATLTLPLTATTLPGDPLATPAGTILVAMHLAAGAFVILGLECIARRDSWTYRGRR